MKIKKKIINAVFILLTASLLAVNGSAIINNKENLLTDQTNPHRITKFLTSERNVTRREAVTFIVNIIKNKANIDENSMIGTMIQNENSDIIFNDIDETVKGYEDIIYAKNAGLIQGDKSHFFPEKILTKREYAKIVGRMFDMLKNYGIEYKLPNPNTADLKDYIDYHTLKGDEENYYSVMMQIGLIKSEQTEEVKSPELTITTQLLDAEGKVKITDLENLQKILNNIQKTNFAEFEKNV